MATTSATLTTDAWTDLGTTPCSLQYRRGAVRFVIDTVVPTDLKAPHFNLTSKEGSADIGVASQRVYARCGEADGMTSFVAVVR